MTQEEIYINGELLRLRREAGGWVIHDMATRACLSVKQIRQLEDGGMSSFYSQAVKATAAKKLGALLGLSPEEVFARVSEPEPEATTVEVVDHPHQEPIEVAEVSVPLALSQVAPENVEISLHSDNAPISASAAAVVVAEPKSKSSLWVIAGLFAAALAVAAYLQPQEESASDPVPPLLVLPTEEPASAASAAEVSVAAPLESASVPVVLPKPAAVGGASAASAASVAISPSPVASGAAPALVRAASALPPASATAPAANKAP
jgi:transcriptional regulator with XRE-family HTH domain